MSKHKYRNHITYDMITDENVKCENCAYWKERYAPHPYCIKTSENDFCGEFKKGADDE